MIDNKKRKAERLQNITQDTMSPSMYNAVIGGVLVYGFILNIIIVLIGQKFFMSMQPLTFLILYFISCIAGTIISGKSTNPMFSFLGYNLVVVPIGGLLAICLPSYPINLIISAIAATTIVTLIMMCLSTAFPHIFAGMGRTLFIALLVSLIAEVILMLLGQSLDIFNWIFVAIFSGYIGYDWYKAQAYPKTMDNAVDSALDIYLDIINLFIRILEILSKSKKR